jgi:molybdate transport system substrate-binding protein
MDSVMYAIYITPMRLLRSLLAALAIFTPGAAALAADTQVAAAANFTEPAKEIAAGFAKATGHRAMLSFGSSGAFYAQMTHGAPFEIFLSADADRPKKAEQDGIAVPGTRFTYAVGRLVLYSTDPRLIDKRGDILKRGNFAKLSIADPAAAPYGLAAVQTLQRLNLYPAVLPKIAKGTSITQAYDFVATGAAPLGFVALSQVIAVPGGSRWIVPKSLHGPIEQQAVLLKVGAGNPAARAFLQYLRSPAALRVIKRYGYETH